MITVKPSTLRKDYYPGYRAALVSGFTLVEMLVVIVVIAILMALTVPSFIGSMNSSRLSSSGDQVFAMLSQAQQIAAAEGRPVEVRFYSHELSGEPVAYRSIVLMRYYEAGEPNPDRNDAAERVLTAPLQVHRGEFMTLPSSVVLSSLPEASTLLQLPPPTGAPVRSVMFNSAGKQEYKFPVEGSTYKSFVIRPETTNLAQTAGTKWFVTAILESEQAASRPVADIRNFYCVQIDPVNARITTYRP